MERELKCLLDNLYHVDGLIKFTASLFKKQRHGPDKKAEMKIIYFYLICTEKGR